MLKNNIHRLNRTYKSFKLNRNSKPIFFYKIKEFVKDITLKNIG